MRRFAVAVSTSLVAVSALGACGIGGESELQSIDQDDLQGLDATTTSTTTTTTTTTAPVTPASVPATSAASSTTIVTEPVQLFFVDGDRLQPVRIDLAATATPSRVVQALLEGRPTGEAGIGLRTLLPEDLVNSVDPSGDGDATVDLATEEFNRIDPADQRTAIAQIVMTLVNRPGIGQVRFTTDGEPQRVPRRDGLQSEPGEGVSLNDYVSLLADAPAPITTVVAVTTTTSPPVTDPSNGSETVPSVGP